MNNQNEIAQPHPAGKTPGVKPVYPTQACQTFNCEIAIHIGVFFDGTAMGVGNNRDDNTPRLADSNVSRRFKSWLRIWPNITSLSSIVAF